MATMVQLWEVANIFAKMDGIIMILLVMRMDALLVILLMNSLDHVLNKIFHPAVVSHTICKEVPVFPIVVLDSMLTN